MYASIVYATKINAPDWQEQIITDKAEYVSRAALWAKANGFDRIRLVHVDLAETPDFSKAVQL